jgi:hypothetical protein
MTRSDAQGRSGFHALIAAKLTRLVYTLRTGPLAWLSEQGFVAEVLTPSRQALDSRRRFLDMHFEPISDVFDSYFPLFGVPA